jgi:hypothetical protein
MKAIKGFEQEDDDSDDESHFSDKETESDNEDKGFLKTMSKLRSICQVN